MTNTTIVCEHSQLRRSCEVCQWRDEAMEARAEVERLRKLCASRPKLHHPIYGESVTIHQQLVAKWTAKIDAAGRGEG
jgi:hypothetical protein